MNNKRFEEMRQRLERVEAENRSLAEQLFNEDRRTENAKQEMREAQEQLKTALKRNAELQHSYKWLEQKVSALEELEENVREHLRRNPSQRGYFYADDEEG